MKVNEKLQLIGLPGVYSLGDCSIFTPKLMTDGFENLYKVKIATV